MMEKGLKVNVKKAFLLKEPYQSKLPSFHAQLVEEEWEVTPFYVPNEQLGALKMLRNMKVP